MCAVARQKSHQWTVPGFPEHVSTQEGTKNIGSNVFVKARESRYIKVTVWKYKVSFELSMENHPIKLEFSFAWHSDRNGPEPVAKHVQMISNHWQNAWNMSSFWAIMNEISRGQLVSNIKPSTNLMPATRAKGVSCSFGLSSGVIHKFL